MRNYKCVKDFNLGYNRAVGHSVPTHFSKNEIYFIDDKYRAFDNKNQFITYLSSGEFKNNFISAQEDRDQKLEEILN